MRPPGSWKFTFIRWMRSCEKQWEQKKYIHYCYHHSQEGKAIKRCAFVPWMVGERERERAQLLRCWSGACQVNNKYNMQIKIIKRESGKKLQNEKIIQIISNEYFSLPSSSLSFLLCMNFYHWIVFRTFFCLPLMNFLSISLKFDTIFFKCLSLFTL